MQKIDWTAIGLFLLALAQNMTGTGSDWFGFVLFYIVGIFFLVRALQGLAPKLEWQLKMLITVMVGLAIIAGTKNSVSRYIEARHPHQYTKEELADAIASRLPKTLPASPHTDSNPSIKSAEPTSRPPHATSPGPHIHVIGIGAHPVNPEEPLTAELEIVNDGIADADVVTYGAIFIDELLPDAAEQKDHENYLFAKHSQGPGVF